MAQDYDLIGFDPEIPSNISLAGPQRQLFAEMSRICAETPLMPSYEAARAAAISLELPSYAGGAD